MPSKPQPRTLSLRDVRRTAGVPVQTGLRAGAAQASATLNLQKASDNMQEAVTM